MRVLGIDAHDDLVSAWTKFLAPARQPFLGTLSDLARWHPDPDPREPDANERDTYELYAAAPDLRMVWLDEDRFGRYRDLCVLTSCAARSVRVEVRFPAFTPGSRCWDRRSAHKPMVTASSGGHHS